jgi:hypothetical protein
MLVADDLKMHVRQVRLVMKTWIRHWAKQTAALKAPEACVEWYAEMAAWCPGLIPYAYFGISCVLASHESTPAVLAKLFHIIWVFKSMA